MDNTEVIEDYPIGKVIVDREARQRSTLKGVEQLAKAIDIDGQLHPITLDENGKLISGETRLEACKLNGYATIRAQIKRGVSVTAAYRMELQENLARKSLPWQDEARAITIFHQMKLETVGAMWTLLGTANDLGLSKSQTQRYIVAGQHLDDKEVMACNTLDGALNLLKGRADRAKAAASARGLGVAAAAVATTSEPKSAEDLISSISLDDDGNVEQELDDEEVTTDELDGIGEGLELAGLVAEHESSTRSDTFVEQGDFVEWAAVYSGPKFDVLHIDFPYGMDYKGSNTRKTGKAHITPAYADSPDVLWRLVDALLEHQDRLAFDTAHMIFWFDMRFYQPLVDTITAAGWTLCQPHPLIWHKPYQGVASDHKRRPRHTYETALLFSRGDRKIVKLDQDVFVGRIDEKLHMNQKPQDMLRHFLRLVVDKTTAVFDPTCGSGSALAAALQLGSPRVFGLELDEENAEVAQHIVARDGYEMAEEESDDAEEAA